MVAKREYVATVRKRLELRRLDFDSSRISGERPRHHRATGAYGAGRQCPPGGVCARVAQPGTEIRCAAATRRNSPRVRMPRCARRYSKSLVGWETVASPDTRWRKFGPVEWPTRAAPRGKPCCMPSRFRTSRIAFAQRLLEHTNPEVPVSAIDALRLKPEAAAQLLTRDWLEEMSTSRDGRLRCLAARAVAVRGDAGTEVIYRLLRDEEAEVRAEAIRTAGVLENREYRDAGDPRSAGSSFARTGYRRAGGIRTTDHRACWRMCWKTRRCRRTCAGTSRVSFSA